MKTLENDWTKPDADGTIHMPDEFDSLFNKIGFQIRFHTFSDKNETQTIADIIWIADQFFKKKYGQLEEIELPEGWLSPKRELPEQNGIRVNVLTNKNRQTIARFERFLGSDIWETDFDSEEDEKVIGWKKIEYGEQIDLFSV